MYSYSFNGQFSSERFNGELLCKTREEAFEAAKRDNRKGYSFVYIGRVIKFEPRIDVDRIIRDILHDVDNATDEEYGEYLANITDLETNTLTTMLVEAYKEWEKKFNLQMDIFYVVNVEKRFIGEGEGEDEE